ncbi:MAG: YbfB/YjiJ family MFS transporter [Gammaproteobacteria bacterium]|nr:YbfB/YjiJ family MFS transporter [Gammaproteobacteria bacterium]
MLGIARFSYTPLLPIMQQQAGLGIAESGWLAGVNYMGYFCGAVIASFIKNLELKDRLYRLGLIVAVLTTALMGLSNNIWLWEISRFFAGLSSAAGLLLGSGLIMNWLIRHGHKTELGIHFSGLGFGIVVVALGVELMSPDFNWAQQWISLSFVGLFLFIPAWLWLPKPKISKLTNSGKQIEDKPPEKSFIYIFMLAYFCAGIGYVVSATFIVAIVDLLPGLEGKGTFSFLILGLAAAPACILFDFIARRIGIINSLIMAYSVQIVAIIIPSLTSNIILIMFSTILFGMTFLGIVSLVLTMAGRFYPSSPARLMGKMTIAYGIAQILAPIFTGYLTEQSGNYNYGLYFAAIMMCLGTLFLFLLQAKKFRGI